MRKAIILAALLLSMGSTQAGGETINRIAAVVNDDVITTHELDNAVAVIRAELPRKGEGMTTAERRELDRRVLENLIEELLLRQRGAQLGLSVSDEEVESALKDVQRQNQVTRPQLEEALKSQGIPFDRYREDLRSQILRYKVLGREVQGKTEVTSHEIRDFFREHIDDYREPPFVRLSRITFRLPQRASQAQTREVRIKAEGALERLRAGEDFYTVLLGFAADKGVDGGDMGSFAEGELSPLFDRGIRDLPEGGVSELLEGGDGFTLLRVEERNPGRIRQFDAVKDEIRKTLLEKKSKERFEEWKKELREKAFIDIRL